LQRATQENAELKARIRELEAAAPIDAKAPEK
jgi:BMFP domain-containing protein YqiC